MKQTRSNILQKRLRDEAMVMLSLGGCETNVSDYRQAIRLVGKAYDIPLSTTEDHFKLINAAKEEMQRKCVGEDISESVIPDEIIANWKPIDIHETVMGLFEASLQLERCEERQALFNMANVLLETQSFEDWIVNLADEATPSMGSLT